MNRDDIIRMAREAGAKPGIENEADAEFFERFAAIIACAERKAIEPIVFGRCISDNNAQEIVNAIRERNNQ